MDLNVFHENFNLFVALAVVTHCLVVAGVLASSGALHILYIKEKKKKR